MSRVLASITLGRTKARPATAGESAVAVHPLPGGEDGDVECRGLPTCKPNFRFQISDCRCMSNISASNRKSAIENRQLFVPQRHHRVHLGRSKSGNVTRGERHAREDERNREESGGIGGTDSVKQT